VQIANTLNLGGASALIGLYGLQQLFRPTTAVATSARVGVVEYPSDQRYYRRI